MEEKMDRTFIEKQCVDNNYCLIEEKTEEGQERYPRNRSWNT